jgi:16S rRNA (guanine527-N7)-methyltransferase
MLALIDKTSYNDMVMFDVVASTIAQGANELNIELPSGTGAAFGVYYDLLEKRGQNVNLTAVSGTEDVVRLHFLDSLALLTVASLKDALVIDIGSGAGFPGVPLLLAEPSITLTLLDARGKRITFLTELCTKLGVDATYIKARAEEAAHTPEIRERYDIALSRAVARLHILCELCLPFVRVGGSFIAMKGSDTAMEIEEAQNAIEALGAKLQGCFNYTIPGTDISHSAVVIDKISKTNDNYPRRYAKIQKSPL